MNDPYFMKMNFNLLLKKLRYEEPKLTLKKKQSLVP
jgi:hypothetical protein